MGRVAIIQRVIGRGDLPAAQNPRHAGIGRIAGNIIEQVGGIGRQLVAHGGFIQTLHKVAGVRPGGGGQQIIADRAAAHGIGQGKAGQRGDWLAHLERGVKLVGSRADGQGHPGPLNRKIVVLAVRYKNQQRVTTRAEKTVNIIHGVRPVAVIQRQLPPMVRIIVRTGGIVVGNFLPAKLVGHIVGITRRAQ